MTSTGKTGTDHPEHTKRDKDLEKQNPGTERKSYGSDLPELRPEETYGDCGMGEETSGRRQAEI